MDIRFPKAELGLELKEKPRFVNILIDSSYNVFVESQQVIYYDELHYQIMKVFRSWNESDFIHGSVLLSADYEVPYWLIENITNEVSKLNKSWIGHLVENQNQQKQILVSYLDVDYNNLVKWSALPKKIPIKYKAEYTGAFKHNSKTDFEDYFTHLKKQLLNENKNIIKDAREKYNILEIKVLPNKKYVINSQSINSESVLQTINNKLAKENILLFYIDSKLSYQEYILFLEILQQVKRKKLTFENGLIEIIELGPSLNPFN